MLDPQQVTDLRQQLSLARRRVGIALRHFGLAHQGLCLVLPDGYRKAAEQLVRRDNNKEVNHRGGDQKSDHRTDERPVAECLTEDAEPSSHVPASGENGDQRSEERLVELHHQVSERGADNHRDSKIDDVAAENEFTKTFEHRGTPDYLM